MALGAEKTLTDCQLRTFSPCEVVRYSSALGVFVMGELRFEVSQIVIDGHGQIMSEVALSHEADTDFVEELGSKVPTMLGIGTFAPLRHHRAPLYCLWHSQHQTLLLPPNGIKCTISVLHRLIRRRRIHRRILPARQARASSLAMRARGTLSPFLPSSAEHQDFPMCPHSSPSPVPRRSTAALIVMGSLLARGVLALSVPLQLQDRQGASDLTAMIAGLVLVLTAAALLLLLRLAVVWTLVLIVLAPPWKPLATLALLALRGLAPRLARRLGTAAATGVIAGSVAFGGAALADGTEYSPSADGSIAAPEAAPSHGMGPSASARIVVPMNPSGETPPNETAGSDSPRLSWGNGAADVPDDSASNGAENSITEEGAADASSARVSDVPLSEGPTPTVTVAPGDSLWSISARLIADGELANMPIERAWPLIYEANHSAIGDNPDHILPGTQLTIPADATVGAPSSDTPQESR